MKKIILFTLVLIWSLGFYGCSEEDSTPSDSNPNDERSYFDGSRKSVEEIIGPDMLVIIQKLKMPLNYGSTPPNIDITCLIQDAELLSSNVPGDWVGRAIDSYDLRFENYSSKTNRVDFYGGHSDIFAQKDDGDGAYIAGEGNKFTVYLNLESKLFGHPTDVVVIATGEKVANGIKNIHFLYLMKDDKGDPNGNIIENGTGRVIIDSDGLAESWNPPTL